MGLRECFFMLNFIAAAAVELWGYWAKMDGNKQESVPTHPDCEIFKHGDGMADHGGAFAPFAQVDKDTTERVNGLVGWFGSICLSMGVWREPRSSPSLGSCSALLFSPFW